MDSDSEWEENISVSGSEISDSEQSSDSEEDAEPSLPDDWTPISSEDNFQPAPFAFTGNSSIKEDFEHFTNPAEFFNFFL